MFKKFHPTDPYLQHIYTIKSNPLTVFEDLWWVFCLVVSTGAEIIEGYRSKFSPGKVVHPYSWGINRRRHW